MKNLNKYINIGLIMIPLVISAGSIVVSWTIIVLISGVGSEPQNLKFPYNELVTNLSQSSDPVDKNVLNYYENNTGSLSYSILSVDGTGISTHYGTAWFWGSDEVAGLSYFATNIHVISDLLAYNNNLPNSTYAEKFSLDNPFINFTGGLSFKNSVGQKFTLTNPKLKKLSVIKNENNSNILPSWYPSNFPMYSDLAIISTNLKLPHSSSLDFIDTNSELTYVFNNMKNLAYYIAGFPFDNSKREAVWTTGKYKWVSNKDYSINSLGLTTAANMFGGGWNDERNNYRKPSFSLEIRANGLANNDIYHYSYARQLLLPGLNFSSGSSGSLVTVWNDTTKKLQPLGIYWGSYETKDLQQNTITYYGALDLFYTPPFQLVSGFPYAGYNNTIL